MRRTAWTALPPILLVLCAPASGAELPRLVFSPQNATESDAVRATVLGTTAEACGAYFYGYTEPAPFRIHLVGYRFDPPAPCGDATWAAEVLLEALPAGFYQVVATLDDDPYAEAQLVVSPAPTTVVLGSFDYFGSNFRLELSLRDPRSGALRAAGASRLSPEAAQFWFFDAGNPEVTVKVLDGTPVNGHYWLFMSSMTTVEFTLRIRHCVEGDPPFCSEVREVHSPAGANLDLVDVEAF